MKTVKEIFGKINFLHLKLLDAVIFAVFLLIIIFYSLSLTKASSSELQVIIDTPDSQFIYPLNVDAEYSFNGLNGVSYVCIKDKAVCFTDSPCPNKTCVQAGWISKKGQWTACLPNGIFVRIDGKSDDSLDAVSY